MRTKAFVIGASAIAGWAVVGCVPILPGGDAGRSDASVDGRRSDGSTDAGRRDASADTRSDGSTDTRRDGSTDAGRHDGSTDRQRDGSTDGRADGSTDTRQARDAAPRDASAAGGGAGAGGAGAGGAAGCAPGDTVPGWTSAISTVGSAVKTMLAFAPNDMWLTNGDGVYRFDGVNVTQVLSANSNTIWGTGSDNVWNAANKVSQWDGKTWNDRTPKISNILVSALFGFSAQDVWLIGAAQNKTMILHWDGQGWTDRTAPAGFQPIVLYGTSTNDLWASGNVESQTGVQLAFMHWDGTAWTLSGDPTDAQHQSRLSGAMWGNGPNDVWSMVSPTNPPVQPFEVWHYDGTAWALASSFPAGVLVGPVSRWAANDVWAAASVASDPYPEPAVVHFDGQSWSLERTGDFGFMSNLVAVGAGELWAPGADNRHNRFWHRHLVPCGTTGPGNMTGAGFELIAAGPTAMVAFAPDQLWGVLDMTVSRLSGTAWVPSLSNTPATIQMGALVGTGPTNLWAAAQAVAMFDGVTWTDRTPPAPPLPSALFSADAAWTGGADDFWMAVRSVDTSGPAARPLLHWDGSSWTSFALPAVPNFIFDHTTAIWGSGARDVWAFTVLVGGPPGASYVTAFFHWDGSAWTLGSDLSNPDAAGPRELKAWGAGPKDVWAGASDTQSGLITWHFDGVSWSVVDRVPGPGNAGSVWGSGTSDVWVAAPAGTLRHFDGHAWTTVDPGADSVLELAGAGQSDLWASGPFFGRLALFHLQR